MTTHTPGPTALQAKYDELLKVLAELERSVPLSVFDDIKHRDTARYWRLADALDEARAVLKRAMTPTQNTTGIDSVSTANTQP